MNKFRLLILLLPFLFISCQKVEDKLILPKIFSDHLVLQRGQSNLIWGWSNPGVQVDITLSGDELEDKYQSQTGDEGKWTFSLPEREAGGPYKLTIQAGALSDTISDIYFGEVWLCGGQSNMEFTLQMLNKTEAIQNSKNPMIRFIDVPRKVAFSPQDDMETAEWQLCDPSTTPDLSAVAYFFAQKIYEELGVPIGLISSNWGGTVVETWISEQSARKVKYYQEALDNLGTISLEELRTKALEQFKQKYSELSSLPLIADHDSLSSTEINHDNWPEMEVPGLWEGKGLKRMNGVVWFRKDFILDAEPDGKAGLLSLGKIDDDDDTYINGKLIGSKSQEYNTPRNYKLDDTYLKKGKNTIMVRIGDTGGGGGFWSAPEEMYVEARGKKISLAGAWKYRVTTTDLSVDVPGLGPNGNPTLLYNGMIHPIEKYGIKGAIWYQGESNEGRGEEYQTLFPLLINDWREIWGQDFSFYFVQLASFDARNPAEDPWAEVREAQTKTLNLAKTGMAVTIDIGEADDIHPKNKEDVGKRLALWALAKDYGQKELVYSGPLYEEAEIQNGAIYLDFDHTGSGLMIGKGDRKLKGFEIAGQDRKFYPAKAVIQGDQVKVSSQQVAVPASVRYAWSNNPEDANLFNKEGLPASPFRTDTWPLNSKGKVKDYKLDL